MCEGGSAETTAAKRLRPTSALREEFDLRWWAPLPDRRLAFGQTAKVASPPIPPILSARLKGRPLD